MLDRCGPAERSCDRGLRANGWAAVPTGEIDLQPHMTGWTHGEQSRFHAGQGQGLGVERRPRCLGRQEQGARPRRGRYAPSQGRRLRRWQPHERGRRPCRPARRERPERGDARLGRPRRCGCPRPHRGLPGRAGSADSASGSSAEAGIGRTHCGPSEAAQRFHPNGGTNQRGCRRLEGGPGTAPIWTVRRQRWSTSAFRGAATISPARTFTPLSARSYQADATSTSTTQPTAQGR